MLSFECDYNQGAHEKIIEKLIETNTVKQPGYGVDEYCLSAIEKIKAQLNCPQADIFFLTGGTQTNQTVIDAMLSSYEGVIAAPTGHISVHEAGAIEHTGHKVIEVVASDGKLSAASVRDYLINFYLDSTHEHMVSPGMVYISHPTEYGTLYTKEELSLLSQVCREYNIPLYLDGARLGYGLMSRASDMKLCDIAAYCDAFYIGATKVGALCGEAVVFTKNNTPKHFLTSVKQHGAMLAKGRLLGVQFDVLFTDELYYKISKNAIDTAERLKEMFIKKGYEFFIDSPTNQLFVILANNKMKELSEKVRFSVWEKYDEAHTVVRFATSWSTTDEELNELNELI